MRGQLTLNSFQLASQLGSVLLNISGHYLSLSYLSSPNYVSPFGRLYH